MHASAFEQALRPLLARSAGYAYSFLRDRGEAEDAVQQAALHAWKHRARYDGSRPFKPWWFAILRNHCLDKLRKAKPLALSSDEEAVNLVTPADESALDRLALDAAMAKLPPDRREVLRLRYFGDLSYQEMAQVLDIPEGTVMSRLHLARKALAALMATEES